MFRRIRSSYSATVATVALFLALGGGGAVALATSSSHKPAAKPTSRGPRGPRGFRGKSGATGPKGATGATGPAGAANPNATNSAALGGLPASAFTQSSCNSQSGAVKGFAQVAASLNFSPKTTSVPGYSCAGQGVVAFRSNLGDYIVTFTGSPVTVVVGNAVHTAATLTPSIGLVSVTNVGPGQFEVFITNPAGGLEDAPFDLVAP